MLGDLLSKHYQGVVDESKERAPVAELREYERESQALQTEHEAEREEAKVKLNETKAALDEVRNQSAMDAMEFRAQEIDRKEARTAKFHEICEQRRRDAEEQAWAKVQPEEAADTGVLGLRGVIRSLRLFR